MPSYKGRFIPKNPQKYNGDPTKIIYRSSWELMVFRRCDEHPDIVEWSSEEIAIPYMNPVKNKLKGKMSRYFPDLVIKTRIGENKYKTTMIEIKPKKQTAPPDPSNRNKTPTGRVSRRYINESMTYAVNEAKWNAAKIYCRERGWDFIFMTEAEIKPLRK